jgi:hypothetical protein
MAKYKNKVHAVESFTTQTFGGGGGAPSFYCVADAQVLNPPLLKIDLTTLTASEYITDLWGYDVAHGLIVNQLQPHIVYTVRWSTGWDYWNYAGGLGDMYFIKVNLLTGTKEEVLAVPDTLYMYSTSTLEPNDGDMCAYNEDKSRFWYMVRGASSYHLVEVNTATMTVNTYNDVLAYTGGEIEQLLVVGDDVYVADSSGYPSITVYKSTPSNRNFTASSYPFSTAGSPDPRIYSVNYSLYPNGSGGSYMTDTRAYHGADIFGTLAWEDASGYGYVDHTDYDSYAYFIAPGIVRIGDKLITTKDNQFLVTLDMNTLAWTAVPILQDVYVNQQLWLLDGSSGYLYGILAPWSETEVVIVTVTTNMGADRDSLALGYWVVNYITGETVLSQDMALVSGVTAPWARLSSYAGNTTAFTGGGSGGGVTTTITPTGVAKEDREFGVVGYYNPPKPNAPDTTGGVAGVESTPTGSTTDIVVIFNSAGNIVYVGPPQYAPPVTI